MRLLRVRKTSIAMALMLVLGGCTKTVGPQKLSQPVYDAGRRAVPLFQKANQLRDAPKKDFDPQFTLFSKAADDVGHMSCNCSDAAVRNADQTFQNDVHNCVTFLTTYREAREKMRVAQLKDEFDQAVTEKDSAAAVLSNCDAGLSRATRK